MRNRLTRSNDRWLSGICGGLAEYLGWSPGLTRIAFVLLSVLSAGFPGMLVYVILWFVMPKPDARHGDPPRDHWRR